MASLIRKLFFAACAKKDNDNFTMYSFRRISAYSPSDASKVYERPVNRRVTAVFDPKCTISNLKVPPDASTVESRRALIEQYLHVRDASNKC